MNQLRTLQIYAWPEPGDGTVTDAELRQWLNEYVDHLRAYARSARDANEGLLLWIS